MLQNQFQDVTDSSFPQFSKESDLGVWERWEDTDGDGLVDSHPSYGVAWGDFNGDGYVDLWLNNHFGDRSGPAPALFINQQDGTFVDRIDLVQVGSDGAIASGDRHGNVWADFDNDGDQDLIQLVGLNSDSEPSRNKIYFNEGGMLVERAAALGITYPEARAREATVFDFNNDGLLDFVHGALADGSKNPELPPTIFQQNPDGTFTDVGAAIGFQFPQGYGTEYVSIADFNGDGRLEVVQKQPNEVFDISSGTYTNVTATLFEGVDLSSNRGLVDLAIADFNGDLIPDLFLPTSINTGHRLFLSSPTGWQNRSVDSGVDGIPFQSTDGGGVVVGDLDNDMDLDIFVLDRTGTSPDYILENLGDGTFTALPFSDSAPLPNLERPFLRSTAIADFDNDGFLDLLETTDRNDPTYRLLKNTGNSNNWLLIDLEGTVSNRDGIGATVYITAGGVTQVRQQTQGQHHRAQDDKRIHFGLGDQAEVTEIRIKWPSGIEQTLSTTSANQVLQIVESSFPNDPPMAEDDTATVGQNGSVQIPVLANDKDIDADPLSISSVSDPINGTADEDADGNIQYIPNEGFLGEDSFTYTISDGELTDTATVTVTVNNGPVATVDGFTGDEDTLITGNVLDNDGDANGDTLTATIDTNPTNGSVVLNADGSFAYTPNANFNGSDSFIYVASDGVFTDVATVNITLNPVNDDPTAVDDSATTVIDTAVSINVVGNDSDVDGDSLSIDIVGSPSNGSAVMNSSGTVTYTPTPGFTGSDSFTYTISDGANATATATVNIAVTPNDGSTLIGDENDNRIEGTSGDDLIAGQGGDDKLLGQDGNDTLLGEAGNDRLLGGNGNDELLGGEGVDILLGGTGRDRLSGGLGNDRLLGGTDNDELIGDAGVDRLFGEAGDDLLNGGDGNDILSGDAGNDVLVGGQGDDALTGGAEADTFGLEIGAGTDTINDFEQGVDLIGLTGGLTFSDLSIVQQGSDSLILAGGETLAQVIGVTSLGAVDFTVIGSTDNEAPVATVDNVSGDEDSLITGNVLNNDTDTNGDSLTTTLATGPANGSVTIAEDGSFEYTPAANFNGSDSFTYTLSDGELSTTGTVNITVNAVNDAPVAADDSISTLENQPVTIDVLNGDSDIDGDLLSVSAVSNGSNGTVTINSDGTVEYTPDIGFSGDDGFTYTVSDGELTDVGTVSVAVSAVNQSPIAVADEVTGAEDAVISGNVLNNDTDEDGDALTVALASGPANGSVTLNIDGSFEYTPVADFNGTDGFTYTVSDGSLTDVGTVTVTVNAVNDAPAAVNDVASTDIDTAIDINVVTNDSDVDGDSLLISNVSSPTNGSAVVSSAGIVTYTPNAGFSGEDSFTYTVNDGELSSTATVNVTINSATPTITGDENNNRIVGTPADDVIAAGGGDDKVLGQDGNDTQFGEAGNDRLIGGNGNDRLFGGEDNDILLGGPGEDRLIGGQGSDRLLGGNDNDELFGDVGVDRLFGEGGDDTLNGGDGNDVLLGDSGNDVLVGDVGNDALTGGAGEDTFVLAVGEGTDTINDFEQGTDKIGLVDGLTFEEISLVQQGSNLLIQVGTETLAQVIGVSGLSEVDFTAV